MLKKQILFILLALFSFSCEKEETPTKIEFYKVLNIQECIIDSLYELDFSKMKTETAPFFKDSDLLSVDWKTMMYTFTKEARAKLPQSAYGTCLVMKVNSENIFAFTFESPILGKWGSLGHRMTDMEEFDLDMGFISMDPTIPYPTKPKLFDEKLKKALEESGRLK
ncbi:MAG: hypothetical protein KA313_06835 [Pseudarcicella sp.]|nr:hypothetical protein [Pseudarcicella sp.]MBP6410796.1 hypothetical protein [Pseudarcicella sp.]